MASPVHPSLLLKKIIHVDMDAFYASVEVLDNPELNGKPVIVGGHPDSRGVVATASYEARAFGVRSAMASAKAKRLCPQGIFVKPRFERYREISHLIREIFHRYTDRVEPLSLDEAYLDVTDNVFKLFAVEIARRIRQDIFKELGLTASAGVGPNKMLAKIASDLKKPNGLAVITPEQVAAFMPSLALRKIHGVGPVSAKKLAESGLETCGDVSEQGPEWMERKFGNFGVWLYYRAQGLDDRNVEIERIRKSMGLETTFARDLVTKEEMLDALKKLGVSLAEDMRESGKKGRTITLKVRYADFRTATRALTFAFPTASADLIVQAAVQLLAKTDALRYKVRLLGISLSRFEPEPDAQPLPGEYVQRSLFGD